MINRLLFIVTLCLPLMLHAVNSTAVSKYEADVTKKWPRVEYGPQTTLYREQCEAWVLRLMFERNKQNKTRDRAKLDASWNLYASHLVWCQQWEPYPRQHNEQPTVATRSQQ